MNIQEWFVTQIMMGSVASTSSGYDWTLNGTSYATLPSTQLSVGAVMTVTFIANQDVTSVFVMLCATASAGYLFCNNSGEIQRTGAYHGEMKLDGVVIADNSTPWPDDGLEHTISITASSPTELTYIGRYSGGTDNNIIGTIKSVSVTGITNTDVYPTGTANFVFDQPYSDTHEFVDLDNGVVGTKVNDVPADYIQV